MTPRNVYFPIYVRQTPDEFCMRLIENPQYAAQWARRAAVQGRPDGQLAWGHVLLNGHGVKRDPEAAYRWFERAAREGFAEALNMVGRCHELGWGVPVNSVAAVYWYRRAADKGYDWGQYNLACQYLHGRGCGQDYAQALILFVRAARGGNAKAMNKLGRYREEGWNGHVKLSSARFWYQRAAVRGCFRGQFHLARLLADEGDIDSAVHWFGVSCASAPLRFCREAGMMLVGHANQRLADVGRDALARASGEVAPMPGCVPVIGK